MIHVKQYLKGEMFDYKRGDKVRFCGEIYTYSFEKTDLDWDYWDAPWEREAYSYMEAMYYMYCKEIDT